MNARIAGLVRWADCSMERGILAFVVAAHLSVRLMIGTPLDGVVVWSSVAAFAVAFWCVRRSGAPAQLSFGMSYLLYLGISVLGAAVTFRIDRTALDQFAPWVIDWYFSKEITLAVWLSGLACLGFGAGCVLCGSHRRALPLGAVASVEAGPVPGWRSIRCDRGVFLVGCGLCAVFLIYMVYNVVTGGIKIAGSYDEYRKFIEGRFLYSAMLFVYATGMTFIASGVGGGLWAVALAVCAFPAALLFMTGNRGEVLYPALAAAAALSLRGLRVRKAVIVFGLFSILTLVVVVRQVRSVGISDADLKSVNLGLESAIVEMGFQARTVVESIGWIESGEPHCWGYTYVLPFQRMVGRLFPDWRPELEGSRFYFDERLPGWGFSSVAEAFYNFGEVGVFPVFCLLGIVLTLAERRRRSGVSLAFAAAVLAVLINNIRNPFAFVPGQVIGVALMALVARWANRLLFPHHLGAEVAPEKSGKRIRRKP